jgi:hypothetical protein
MKPLKIIMPVHFLQFVIQAQDLFIISHFYREFAFNFFDFIGLGFELFHYDVD